jgi:hypothetical protein
MGSLCVMFTTSCDYILYPFCKAYIHHTGGIHCDISTYAYNVPGLDSFPPSFSLTSLPLLKTISAGLIVFTQIHKVHLPQEPIFTLSVHPPLSLEPTPKKEWVLFVFSVYSFKGVSLWYFTHEYILH